MPCNKQVHLFWSICVITQRFDKQSWKSCFTGQVKIPGNCELKFREFHQRTSDFPCQELMIMACLFSGCSHDENGGAIYVSTTGSVGIKATKFSDCSSRNCGGAMSIMASVLSLVQVCHYNCCSLLPASSQNVFHADQIFGAQHGSPAEVDQCAFAFCPRDFPSSDETIGLWQHLEVLFKRNNFTENNLGALEMITFYPDVVVKETMLHCNLDHCTSSWIIYDEQEIRIEKCNIHQNEPGTNNHCLIYDGGPAALEDCVIAFNSHPHFSQNSRTTAVSSFFCGNTFAHNGIDTCVPTIKLSVLEAELCRSTSHRYTRCDKALSFCVFSFHLMTT